MPAIPSRRQTSNAPQFQFRRTILPLPVAGLRDMEGQDSIMDRGWPNNFARGDQMKYPIHNVRNNLYHYYVLMRRNYLRYVYGMKIGSNTRIAPSARLDRTNPKGVNIGENTSISFRAAILTHDFINNRHVDTFIGNNCFIGSGATILPGVRVGDHCIVGAGSVVMSNVPDNTIVAGNPARLIRSGIRTGEYGVLEKGSPERSEISGKPQSTQATEQPEIEGMLNFLQSSTGLDAESVREPLENTEIDSLALITLRATIETKYGVFIPDREWVCIRSLADIADLPSLQGRAPLTAIPHQSLRDLQLTKPIGKEAVYDPGAEEVSRSGNARATYSVDMPQMALSGLSESWMTKEIGNIHWKMISNFLNAKSSEITDESGERLYATFTRIFWSANTHLRTISENDVLEMSAKLSRYGASFFFSNQNFQSSRESIAASAMSTFAKYGERGVNTSLVKGVPLILDPDAISAYSELPKFATEYRARRANAPIGVIYETEYDLLSPHDINGVGLIYFAAYPLIFDLCLEKYEGKGFLTEHSSSSKDLSYFANADPSETLIFRLHERAVFDDRLEHTCSLSRKSDGARMAQVVSVRKKLS